jgi:hypothetical protein
MPIRKSATVLLDDERDSLLAAVMSLKATIANPGDPASKQISIYDQLVAVHTSCLSVTVPTGETTNMGHQGPAFLPWHRQFLLDFENLLTEHGSTVGLPYWDWTDHSGTDTKLFSTDFLGARSGKIRKGYFAKQAPGSPGNSHPRPSWWPAGLSGWKIHNSLAHTFGTTLRRKLNSRSLAIPEDVRRTLARQSYEDTGNAMEIDPILGIPRNQPRGFRNRLETGLRMHNFGHGWTGGHMGHPLSSPNDLIFYLHHCNIDRLWAEWQQAGHAGTPFYPSSLSGEDEGHKLNDEMWPWVGSLLGYVPVSQPSNTTLRDYSTRPARTPADVLDHTALDYSYE